MIEEFMMDLYGCETIIRDYGFISFKHEPENKVVFVQHFYTTREARGNKKAFQLWNELVEVCQDMEVETVEAIIELYLAGGAQKLLVFNRVGFEPLTAFDNQVVVQNKNIRKFESGEYDGR